MNQKREQPGKKKSLLKMFLFLFVFYFIYFFNLKKFVSKKKCFYLFIFVKKKKNCSVKIRVCAKKKCRAKICACAKFSPTAGKFAYARKFRACANLSSCPAFRVHCMLIVRYSDIH